MRNSFKNILKILSSGIISGLGLAAISSTKLSPLNQNLSIFFLLYYQLEVLGLTIVKLGIDQIVFVRILQNENRSVNLSYLFKKKYYYLTILYTIVIAAVNPNINFILLGITILFDVYSILSLAELNAKKKINNVVYANLLNFPIFILIIFILKYFNVTVNEFILVSIFLFTSFIRALYLLRERQFRINHETKYIELKENNLTFGSFQVLNYFFFKGDTAILTILDSYMPNLISKTVKSEILFYSRVPEIYSSIVTMIYPIVHENLSYVFSLKVKFNFAIYIFSLLIVSLLFFVFYTKVLSDVSTAIAIPYVLAYSLQVVLILPVYWLILKKIKANKISEINLILLVSIFISTSIILTICFSIANYSILPFLPILQMIVFYLIKFLISKKFSVVKVLS